MIVDINAVNLYTPDLDRDLVEAKAASRSEDSTLNERVANRIVTVKNDRNNIANAQGSGECWKS